MNALLFAVILAATKPSPPPDLSTPPADAMNIGNGLITKQLAAGSSAEMPSDDDFVKIRYTLWSSPDGKLVVFIAPPQFVVPAVGNADAWAQQTVTLMHAGEMRRSGTERSSNAGTSGPCRRRTAS
jgi:hypothetical protein